MCEGVEKEEESLQAEEVAFALKGLVAFFLQSHLTDIS